jgi:RHH-type proline utilization regulon transcriptional repressor/proline dehydrogenase/delta 1-pyrroline-5-carboxylate dehydrogenase
MVSAALSTGNTVIMKPSEATPAIAGEFMKLMIEAGIPPGVLNFLPGEGDVGEALVKHPDVDAIYFTGSQATGLKIKQMAEQVNRGDRPAKIVSAEMGGKNAIIITSSANLDEAVKGSIKSAFGFSGQKCSAASRIIVLSTVYKKFEKEFTAKFRSIPAGDPRTNVSAALVPLYDRKGVDKVNQYIDIAKDEEKHGIVQQLAYRDLGAEPGNNPNAYWSPAAVYLVNRPKESRLAKEEIFGPVVTIMVVDTLEEAVALANDTPYGLTAGIYSQTPSELEYFTENIEAGNIYINREITGALVNRHPFGGEGMSGQGGEKTGGPDSLNVYTQLKTPGGIDLNAKNMKMDVTKDGQGIDMKFDPAMIAEFQRGDFSGIVPVIIRITPISNVLPILGLQASPV